MKNCKRVADLLLGDEGFRGVEADSQLELGLALGSWEVDPFVLERMEDQTLSRMPISFFLQFGFYRWDGNLDERAGPSCRVAWKNALKWVC